MKPQSQPDVTDGPKTPPAVRCSELVRRSPGRPTGYLIWDDGKLMQQLEYEVSEWRGYWHTTKETEWQEVPTKNALNSVYTPTDSYNEKPTRRKD